MKKQTEEQKQIAERLKKIIAYIGMSQLLFAKRLGVSQQAVSSILKTGKVSKETIGKLKKEFNIDPNWFAYGVGADPTVPKTMANIHAEIPEGCVPVIEWTQVGNYTWGQENELIEVIDYAISPIPIPEGHIMYALRIKGDAMVGNDIALQEGTTIVVDSKEKAKEKDFIVLIRSGEQEAICRQYSSEGTIIYLTPLNDRYPVEVTKLGNFTFCGVVMGRADVFREKQNK